jgi:lipopolysaccharide transport system ATP-binding protein
MSAQVEFRNVSKSFRKLTLGGHTTLKDLLTRGAKAFDGQVRDRRFTALRDVSFTVERGKVLGIIGPNGAGKSTLLKLVAGIYNPTSGQIRVDGRVSALLGLGVGFHPDLTGRENVYISGLALGLSRSRIRALLGEIAHFAEVEEFIDAPVRTYSSGMFMRLAFSVAVNVDPDILLLDEVLSVGDSGFATKSRERIEEFKTAGKTILFVSHDLRAVESWCHNVLWLDHGQIQQVGEAADVVAAYTAQAHAGEYSESRAA